MLGLLDAENAEQFHILSHDLGGPPAVALAYMALDRALSLSTIYTPFFGLDYPGYVDPRVAYWHLAMDITHLLVEGREEQYLFRDFAYNPTAVPESEIQAYATQMRQSGNLRASLNLYGYIPQMVEQTKELTEEVDRVDDGMGWPPVLRSALPRQREGHRGSGLRWCSSSSVVTGCSGRRPTSSVTSWIASGPEKFEGLRHATSATSVEITNVDHMGITVASLQDALEFWGVCSDSSISTRRVSPNDPFIENVVGVSGAALTLAVVEGVRDIRSNCWNTYSPPTVGVP